jgi:hypothetical protein
MSINNSPLDQKVHLEQFEPTFGVANYDHSSQPLTGWRAERQQAESNAIVSEDQSITTVDKHKPVIGKNRFAKIANLFIMPSFSS